MLQCVYQSDFSAGNRSHSKKFKQEEMSLPLYYKNRIIQPVVSNTSYIMTYIHMSVHTPHFFQFGLKYLIVRCTV